ncbi:hypothetical protein SCACP_21750 [Sporomusa carbonis]|uniref:hypothetical protein n=1 Tax=Sporomusa carbonis TaxID=3076075 RepID=UPI003A773BFD
MITIHANLKTGEHHVEQSEHPDDQPITVFTQFLLPDIIEKLKQHKLIAKDEKVSKTV